MDFLSLDAIKTRLLASESDPTMKTVGRYSPAATQWPGSIMPFSEIHLAYLTKNKGVNPAQYLSNLELMIKIRQYIGNTNPL